MDKTRYIQMDIIRGISMILIVLAHTNSPINHFVYLFHLAMFFMLSGYFFKVDNVKDKKSLKIFIKKRIIRLYLPYVISNIICILLNNVFIKVNLYSGISHDFFTIKDLFNQIVMVLLFSNTTEMVGATWFLPILFSITIVYGIIENLLNKFTRKSNLFQLFISILFFYIGKFLISNEITVLLIGVQFFTCYILFDIGRKFSLLKLELNSIIKSLLLILSFVLSLILNKLGTIELSLNIYTRFRFFIAVSILGWIFIYEISYFISKRNVLNRIFEYIGKNTMPIVILHFIIFKFVNLLGIIITNEDISLMSTFPVLFKQSAWWIVYTVFGVLVPLLLNEMLKLIKDKIYIKQCN